MALAAALGIGRFAYTPILPEMLDALCWTKVEGGLIASANYLGYLIGAVLAGKPLIAMKPRLHLLSALALSALSTTSMALASDLPSFLVLRFGGGIASAIVIVCASSLVLERLARAGHESLSGMHFAGVGLGIMISAAAVSALVALGASWRVLWVGAGAIAMGAAIAAAVLIPPEDGLARVPPPVHAERVPPRLRTMVVANGLFGFGYVITATFLVTIVRRAGDLQSIEPWVWMLFGLAAVPSVTIWCQLGERLGIMNAYALACLVEALAVATSVEWVTVPGISVSAVLLGGTFMGITALGLTAARNLCHGEPQRAIGQMTLSFAIGQMIGPTLAGWLMERSGSFRTPSLLAASALLAAAALARAKARGSSER